MEDIKGSQGAFNSVYPCTEYLTFGPWIYLVPQFKPKNVLMLGYAGGTAAGLIRLFYGNIPITAVDIECVVEDKYDVDFVLDNAFEYVKTCDFFDVIIVDVFELDGQNPCGFITDNEFIENVSTKCNYLIVHALEDTDISNYKRLKHLKTLSLNTNRFYYYLMKRIPQLPIL